MNSVIKTTNKLLVYLTLTDVFTWGPFTVISALIGLYLARKLGQDVIQVVGIGTSIYYVTRAAFQIPVGYLTDRTKRDRDEIILLFFGVILMGVPYLIYPVITSQYHYYILQFIFGIGTVLNVTNWRKLFALNIVPGREGTSYAKYETMLSLSAAFLGALVGYIANLGDAYFDIVISTAGIVMISASTWVAMIYRMKNRRSNI